ncbi:unnamed protein product, partial [Mesorhabditis belari]|uniref:Uncharacterized protein n=1 Tax=Mesorhabditis belari TaxID=2138241 RepID=A0AAF3F1C7_9BILA
MLSRSHIAILLSTLCLTKACGPDAQPARTGIIKLTVIPSVGWTYYDAEPTAINSETTSPEPAMSIGGGQTDDKTVAKQTIQDNIEVDVFHVLQNLKIMATVKTTNTFDPIMADKLLPLECKPAELITDIVDCSPESDAEMSGDIVIQLETAIPEGEFETILQGVVDELIEQSRARIVNNEFSYKA